MIYLLFESNNLLNFITITADRLLVMYYSLKSNYFIAIEL